MISSIILAAGESSRMGEPKALLDWGGEPLICHEVRQLRDAGVDEVIVVLGHEADRIHRSMARAQCRVMLNPRFFAGRAGSLRIGAKAVNRDASAILVANVDQPRTEDFLRALLAAHRPEAAATRPAHQGRTGHPVVVAGRLRDEILAAGEANEGLRGILRTHASEVVDVELGELALLDMNTPAEYEEARRRLLVGA
jgi:CTP:molybdopterin cytidylyltransferase MocA